ncbi:MAG: GNAT family N-acetyltransferase [Planctomycetota bacterium]
MAIHPAQTVLLKTDEIVTVRSATPEDADSILELARVTHEDGEGAVSEADEFTSNADVFRRKITAATNHERKLVLVAARDDVIVGYLQFEAGMRRRLAHQGEFGLWVRPEWRSRGIGRVLLAALIAWAPTVGVERIGLTVISTASRALGLYESLGFREEGRRVRQIKFAPDQYADQIHMVRFIETDAV